MIVQYYADSLGLPRPGIVKVAERYIFIFEQWLKKKFPDQVVHIVDRSKRGATVDVLYGIYEEDEEYFQDDKQILIIHEGICDCAPRPVSKRIRRIIGAMPGFIKKRVVHFLHLKRAWLLRHGSVHLLVEPAKYEEIWQKWLINASTKFKRIYVLNIAPTNEDIEMRSPGFQASISKYNSILKRVVANVQKDNINLVDLYLTVANSANIDDLIVREDGHHITALMHSHIAELLIAAESD